ncbi:hypothetical protein BH09MYX1_BH09MYX1_25830 [soil metagenome]
MTIRIAWLSSFHEHCGIATYSESLVFELRKHAVVKVFAPRRIAGDEGRGEQPPRLWNRNRTFGFEALRVRDRILAMRPDVVHLQVNLSLYSSRFLFTLVRLLERSGVPVVATLHGRGGGSLGRRFKVARLLFALRGADIVVHTEAHRSELARERVHVIAHGIDPVVSRSKKEARAILGLDPARPVLAHFGFLVPDKGIAEVIRAVAELRARHADLLYWICGAIYGTDESRLYYAELLRETRALGLTDAVHLTGDFVSSERALVEIGAADFVVLNYQTGGSQGASGAARRALTSGRAVAVSEAPVFDDLREAVHTIRPNLVRSLGALIDDPGLALATTERARRFCEAHSWSRTAEAHRALYERIVRGAP